MRLRRDDTVESRQGRRPLHNLLAAGHAPHYTSESLVALGGWGRARHTGSLDGWLFHGSQGPNTGHGGVWNISGSYPGTVQVSFCHRVDEPFPEAIPISPTEADMGLKRVEKMKTDEVGVPETKPKASSFAASVEDRYFEDYVAGAVHQVGNIVIEEAEMVAFARRFDPQPFHTDPDVASRSVFGGLIASGWYTVSLTMRLLVDHFISHVASLGSPGVDELRWLQPVRPGDTLSIRVTLLEAQRSRSKPHQGFVRAQTEVLNQTGDVVMTMTSVGLFRCRTAHGSADEGNG